MVAARTAARMDAPKIDQMTPTNRALALNPIFPFPGLVGGLAHDFNNLLRIISAYLDPVRSDMREGPRASSRLQNAISGAGAPAATGAATAAEPSKPLNILVVEDEMLVRMSTVDMLEQLGHRVTEFEDGQSALGALAGGGEIDLLITDLGLAGMSGQELVMQVRSIHPEIRIVVASGYELPEEMAAPGTVHLGKPFQLSDLKSAVSRAMANGGG